MLKMAGGLNLRKLSRKNKAQQSFKLFCFFSCWEYGRAWSTRISERSRKSLHEHVCLSACLSVWRISDLRTLNESLTPSSLQFQSNPSQLWQKQQPGGRERERVESVHEIWRECAAATFDKRYEQCWAILISAGDALSGRARVRTWKRQRILAGRIRVLSFGLVDKWRESAFSNLVTHLCGSIVANNNNDCRKPFQQVLRNSRTHENMRQPAWVRRPSSCYAKNVHVLHKSKHW